MSLKWTSALAGLPLSKDQMKPGKTSLSEAIRILFDYLDSSRHSDVKAIKPVNRGRRAFH